MKIFAQFPVTERVFELGSVVCTQSVSNLKASDKQFEKEVSVSLDNYLKCNWGLVSDNDKEMNDLSVKNNDDLIIATYMTSHGIITITTEQDRSVTTIHFVGER